MKVDNKHIYIFWRTLDTSYAYANRKVLVEPPRRIGSSITSVNKMLSKSEEQSELMRDIIAISPNSPEWNKMLKLYWDSISEEIQQCGKKLDIGFTYDIESQDKSKYIKLINDNIKSGKGKLVKDEDLQNYIDNRLEQVERTFNKSIKALSLIRDEKAIFLAQNEAYKIKYMSLINIESERYKVGVPNNAADYMLYRYCLVYKDVANEQALVNKSPNIRFYLHSEQDIEKYKQRKHKLETNRIEAYLTACKDISTVENIIYALGFGKFIPDGDVDKFQFLNEKSIEMTDKFIRIATNKNLKTLGLIEKYIKYDIIRRLEGSQVIVDGLDPSTPLGSTIDETVLWFNNNSNNAIISDYAIRFKNSPKIN